METRGRQEDFAPRLEISGHSRRCREEVSPIVSDPIARLGDDLIASLYPDNSIHLRVFVKIFNQLRSMSDYRSIDNETLLTGFFEGESLDLSTVEGLLKMGVPPCPRVGRLICRCLSDLALRRGPLEENMARWDRAILVLREEGDIGCEGFFSQRELRLTIVNQISLLVRKFYEDEGYKWNDYYAFINPNHPFALAAAGRLCLSPSVFEFGSDPRSVYAGEALDASFRKGNPRSLRFLAEIKRSCQRRSLPRIGRGSAWTKKQLKEAIIRAGLNACGRSDLVTARPEKRSAALRDILTLEKVTGCQEHCHIPLPGFDIIYFVNDGNTPCDGYEKDLCQWQDDCSLDYYSLVYRRTLGTIIHLDRNDWKRSGLSLSQLRHLCEVVAITVAAETDDEDATIAKLLELSSHCRHPSIERSRLTDLGRDTLDDGSEIIWIMSTVGRVKPFVSTLGDLTPYPSQLLRFSWGKIRDALTAKSLSRGFCLFLACHCPRIRSSLPGNLRHVDKSELCGTLLEESTLLILSSLDDVFNCDESAAPRCKEVPQNSAPLPLGM